MRLAVIESFEGEFVLLRFVSLDRVTSETKMYDLGSLHYVPQKGVKVCNSPEFQPVVVDTWVAGVC